MQILNDPLQEFAFSPFIKLEVLLKAIFSRRRHETEYYNDFFDSVSFLGRQPPEHCGTCEPESVCDWLFCYGLASYDFRNICRGRRADYNGKSEQVTIRSKGNPNCFSTIIILFKQSVMRRLLC
jgi:hypothetical protein